MLQDSLPTRLYRLEITLAELFCARLLILSRSSAIMGARGVLLQGECYWFRVEQKHGTRPTNW